MSLFLNYAVPQVRALEKSLRSLSYVQSVDCCEDFLARQGLLTVCLSFKKVATLSQVAEIFETIVHHIGEQTDPVLEMGPMDLVLVGAKVSIQSIAKFAWVTYGCV